MSERRGCFKNGCFGCLGIVVFFVVLVGVNAGIALNRGEPTFEDHVLASDTSTAVTPLEKARVSTESADKPAAGRGWLILELGQGEFEIHPGEPGTGVEIKASYDSNLFKLDEYSHTWPDSAWVYHVRFERTVNGLQAMISEIMGKGSQAKLHIYIPPDLPVELNVLVTEGGLDAELGGLWLTDVDLRYNKGGVALNIHEPLREPLNTMVVHGRMGGAEIQNVGNASPRVLNVSCAMGGMELDLDGEWVGDCDARVSLSMGGMQIYVPDSITLEKEGEAGASLRQDNREVPLPVLRLQQKVKMGEIDIR